MSEQKDPFIMVNENKQNEQYDTDMIQTTTNDNAEDRKVTTKVKDEKLMEESNKTDPNLINNATVSTSSTEEVEVTFPKKTTKKSKKVDDDNPYDLYVKIAMYNKKFKKSL